MSKETIKCLVYRYTRFKECICAVKMEKMRFIPLNEIEYRDGQDFFLDSEFARFLEYKSGCSFDLCIINQKEEQGVEFAEKCLEYYHDVNLYSTVWTEECIKDALSSLKLKKSLIIGNIRIEGKDPSRLDIASIFGQTKMGEMNIDEKKENIEEISNVSEKENLAVSEGNLLAKEKGSRSKLSLAMDAIIAETYHTDIQGR